MTGAPSELTDRDRIPGELPPWWRRRELLLLLAIYAAGIVARATSLPLLGEETRRARYAWHMTHGGDWAVVARGLEPFIDRPPGQIWLIAAVSGLTGRLDPLTIRLGSLIATGLTMLLIYWYAAGVLSRAGSFVAAAAILTMGSVLDIGRRGETEALFTLLLAAALLVWHHGTLWSWPPALTWSSGYLLMALAALTKGTQAPVTFVCATSLFLLLRGDRRMLTHPSHFLGAALSVGVVAVWQVPFLARTSWAEVRDVWLTQAVHHVSFEPARVVGHLFTFPLEVLGAMLPWSVLLAGLLYRSFWAVDEKLRSAKSFLLISIAVIMVPAWLAAGARHRYVMPLIPLACVLIGLVVDRALTGAGGAGLRRLWRDYQRVTALLLTGAAAVFAGATAGRAFSGSYWYRTLAQPAWLAAGMLVTTIVVTAVVWRLSQSAATLPVIAGTGLLSLLIGGLSTGPVLNAHLANAADVGADVRALRGRLPADAELASFELVHHKFAFYFETPIRTLPWPTHTDDVPGDVSYFAFDRVRGWTRGALPFSWETVAEFNMDRTRSANPAYVVVVGRILRNQPEGPERR